MSSSEKRQKKRLFIRKLFEKFDKNKQIFVVNLMNVGSNQVQVIRRALLEKKSELVIGKNTVIKKAIQMKMNQLNQDAEDYDYLKRFSKPFPQLEPMLDLCKQKVGLIFTDQPAYELKPIIESNKVQTQARVGVVAPIDVIIPEGPTGLDPSQISFFHALHISTKIQKGQIEIVKAYQVCTKGKQVGNSECTLLQKLNIKPFEYGMELLSVYDNGAILTPEVVNLTPDDILKKFASGVGNIVAMSLELGIPTECAVPHLISNAFKNLAAISMETDYKLDALSNMAQQKTETAAASKSEVKAAPKEEEKQEEEEEDLDMGDLFG